MISLFKTFLSVLLRAVLLAGAFIVFSKVGQVNRSFVVFSQYFLYILLVSLLILAAWFRKHRTFLVVFFLLALKLPLDYLDLVWDIAAFDLEIILRGIALLWPFNLLLLSLFKKDQLPLCWIFSLLIFLIFQVAILLGVSLVIQLGFMNPLDYDLLPSQFIFRIGHLPLEISFLLLLSFLVSFINELCKLGDFHVVVVNCLLSMIIYSFLAPKMVLSLDILFMLVCLLFLLHIFRQIYDVAYLDQLTGIPSRRALMEKAALLSPNYVVAMIDIDFFKKFNDKYGHDVGDDVLAFVASVLSKTANEPVFRYGGEEFTILFPKTTVKDCWDHLNEICEAVAQSKFKIRRQSSKTNGTERLVSVTISIGVAEQGLKHSSFKEVLKAADRALYRAKKKGRNCVSK